MPQNTLFVRNVKDAAKVWTINAKLVKKSCAGIDMDLAILGESLISTFQSLAKTFQLLGRARHSVAVKVADLAEVMAQRL